MKRWFKFCKIYKDYIVTEDFFEFGSYKTDEDIEKELDDWSMSYMSSHEDVEDVDFGFGEVDLPSEEWLLGNIKSVDKAIGSLENEKDVYKFMLHKYSREYKIKLHHNEMD